MKVDVLFEDNELIVVNKSNNLLVHHSYYARNIREDSLVQLLRADFGDIFPAHRLDRKTSGVMVFARNKDTAKLLQAQFENNQIQKSYLALVRGHTEDAGTVETPIKNEDTGKYKEALTHFKTLERLTVEIPVDPYPTSRYSIIELNPKTGRMHQLRKHMNKIAHPIIGDPKYGNRHHNHMFEEKFGHTFLFLHASKINFLDHKKEKKSFIADLPEFWAPALSALGSQYF